MTNQGTFIADDNSTTNLSGTITNSGTMTIHSTGDQTNLTVASDVMLNGGGTVSLVGVAVIEGTNRLTNVDNTIQGQGYIGISKVAITNQGLINANLNGKTLIVDPVNVSGMINSGTMEASGGGILSLTGSGGGNFDNTGGIIQALTGSEVQLTQNVSITGGTLTTAGDIGDIRVVAGADREPHECDQSRDLHRGQQLARPTSAGRSPTPAA